MNGCIGGALSGHHSSNLGEFEVEYTEECIVSQCVGVYRPLQGNILLNRVKAGARPGKEDVSHGY